MYDVNCLVKSVLYDIDPTYKIADEKELKK